jgi:D-aminopeptidase
LTQEATRRARDLGLPFPGTTGPHNAITDVPGVEVGFCTLIDGEGELVTGKGPVRTGVTAILPRGHKTAPNPVWAGFYALNGNGEMTGTHWVEDAGYFVGPVCITNTHSVGVAHHATVKWMIDTYADAFGEHHVWAMPIIAETYDGVLNDINGLHVQERHVLEALSSAAPGAVAEGNVGGGTGMICYEFKGGTGTSSRVVTIDGHRYTVASLVQANHGQREWLTVLGVPVGAHLREHTLRKTDQGSIIVVIATDVPMLPHQLRRVAKRAALGVGRTGSPGGNNSGDIFVAFSVANEMPLHELAPAHLDMRFVNDEVFDPLYQASVESTEEAIINAMVAAKDCPTLKPAGRVCKAIDHQQLVDVMHRYARAN